MKIVHQVLLTFHKNIYSLMAMFLISFSASKGQTPVPCFSSKDTIGCVPFTVTIQECNTGGGTPRYKYGKTGQYTLSKTFTFTTPGEFDITQLIGDKLLIKENFIKVIVPTTPKFEIANCDNYTINIKISDDQFPRYIIDFGDGKQLETTSGQTIRHSYFNDSVRTVRVTGLFLSGVCPTTALAQVSPKQSYNFDNFFSVIKSPDTPWKINYNADSNLKYSFITPNGTILSTSENKSNLQTIELSDVKDSCILMKTENKCQVISNTQAICLNDYNIISTDTSIDLNWRNSNMIDSTIISRDEIVLSKNSNPMVSYQDTTVKCGKTYCYSVTQKLKNAITYSNKKCLKAISSKIPDAIIVDHISFDPTNTLQIKWHIKAGNSYKNATIYSNSIPLHSTIDFQHSFIPQIKDSCYTINYIDSCDKVSFLSPTICPIVLNVTDLGKGIYQLTWTPYQPASHTITYEVYENDMLLASTNNLAYLSENPDTIAQIKTFKIKTFSNNKEVFSNTVSFEQPLKVFFPTGFSPNDDGLNDQFIAKTRFVKNFKIAIFNVWGEAVFATSNKNIGWDGRGNPSGIYNYVVEAEDYLGNNKLFKGQVTLLR